MFFSKNDKDSHQQCNFFCDFDEKRNGFLIVLGLFLKTTRTFIKIATFLLILMKYELVSNTFVLDVL